MINKIHISYWSKGALCRNYDTSIDFTFMLNFVNTIKKFNPNLEIVFLCDYYTVNTANELIPEILSKVTIKPVLDDFNNFEPHQWPLVKMMCMSSLLDEEIFHLDFDIIWKYDLQNIFNLIESKNIDVLYQSVEMLNIYVKYYSNFLRNNKYAQVIMKNVNNKIAYNAGITYLGKSAKLLLKEIFITYDTKLNSFDDSAAFEQMIIPNLFVLNNLNVEILSDLISELPLIYTQFNFKNVEFGDFTNDYFKFMNTNGAFINCIRYYHFLGGIKEHPEINNILNYILTSEN